jgi:hypothetical protein
MAKYFDEISKEEWMEQRNYFKNRETKRKEFWKKLHEFADEENDMKFWETYVEYLEWEGVISKNRQVLLKMAKRILDRR